MDERGFSRAGDTVQEVPAAEGDASVCVPLASSPVSRRPDGGVVVTTELTFSLAKKSFVSLRSISLTPGLSTMLPMGRLCLESVQRQLPCESAK